MAKHWYVKCNECGIRIALDVYTGEGVVQFRRDEPIPCPDCGAKLKYTGDDFKKSD